MAKLALVCVEPRIPADFFTRTNHGGIARLRPHDAEKPLFIDTMTGDHQDLQAAAKLASAEVDTAVFILWGADDAYEITELIRGDVMRLLALEPQGVTRVWEKPLTLPLDEAQLNRFAETLGFDQEKGAHARFERPGFFQRFIRSVGI